MKVLINGIEQLIAKNSLSIDTEINTRSIASFIILDTRNTLAFKKGQNVLVYDNDNLLVFGGFVETVNKRRMFRATNTMNYNIKCIDYHYLVDKKIIAKSYVNKSVLFIVNDILINYLDIEGITLGFIDGASIIVNEAVFNYIPISDALNSISEKAGFIWYIDENKKLYFQARTTNTSPFTLQNGDCMINSINLEFSNLKYRNKQYVRGGKDETNTQIQNFKGDGANKTFTLAYTLARVPTITVNDISKTVGILGLETGKQFYWNKGERTITQDENQTTLISTDNIKVTYVGEIELIVIVDDKFEIADRFATEKIGTGIVESVIDDKSITNLAAAFEIAQAKINLYSQVVTKITFTTIKKGLKAGQLLTTNFLDYKIQDTFLITSVEISVDNGIVYYSVSGVTGGDFDTWVNVFYKMATQSREFVIKENIQENQLLIIIYNYSKEFNVVDANNIFRYTYPSSELFPTSTTYPSFVKGQRITEIRWYLAGVEKGWKVITKTVEINEKENDFFAFIGSSEANETIDTIKWYGGEYKNVLLHTEILNATKTTLEAFQIKLNAKEVI